MAAEGDRVTLRPNAQVSGIIGKMPGFVKSPESWKDPVCGTAARWQLAFSAAHAAPVKKPSASSLTRS